MCDGAMGTGLQARGLDQGDCPERWNLTRPDDVQAVTAGYVAAGSDLVETNSFGGTSIKLAHYGLAEQAAQINRRAAQIARQAAGHQVLVAASVGPTGALLEPYGPLTEAQAYEAFAQQVLALAEGGADAICIETMLALEEAKIALRAAKENTSLPVLVTFTFDKTARGDFRTVFGVSPSQVARELPAAGADVIGSNCGSGVEQLLEVCRALRAQTAAPLLIQPNAGLPLIENGKTIFPATPEHLAGFVDALVTAGANLIGGCCGTTPAHIAAMRRRLPRK